MSELTMMLKLVDCMCNARARAQIGTLPQLFELAGPLKPISTHDRQEVLKAAASSGSAALSELDIGKCCRALKVTCAELKPSLVAKRNAAAVKKGVEALRKSGKKTPSAVKDLLVLHLEGQAVVLLVRLLQLLHSIGDRPASVSKVWAPLLGFGTDTATLQYLIEVSEPITEPITAEPTPLLERKTSCTWGVPPSGGSEPSPGVGSLKRSVGASSAGASAPEPKPSTLLVVLYRHPGESLGLGVSSVDGDGGPLIISEVRPTREGAPLLLSPSPSPPLLAPPSPPSRALRCSPFAYPGALPLARSLIWKSPTSRVLSLSLSRSAGDARLTRGGERSDPSLRSAPRHQRAQARHSRRTRA